MPDREVVAVIGDGGFQMTIQELGTIFSNKSASKIVVLNNEFLGMAPMAAIVLIKKICINGDD
jgi:acetolactate synthase-1/2/3 large subunit